MEVERTVAMLSKVMNEIRNLDKSGPGDFCDTLSRSRFCGRQVIVAGRYPLNSIRDDCWVTAEKDSGNTPVRTQLR